MLILFSNITESVELLSLTSSFLVDVLVHKLLYTITYSSYFVLSFNFIWADMCFLLKWRRSWVADMKSCKQTGHLTGFLRCTRSWCCCAMCLSKYWGLEKFIFIDCSYKTEVFLKYLCFRLVCNILVLFRF